MPMAPDDEQEYGKFVAANHRRQGRVWGRGRGSYDPGCNYHNRQDHSGVVE